MRSASLDRRITIERASETISAAGVPVTTWNQIASVRADVSQELREAPHASGTMTVISSSFTIRYRDDLELEDRIILDGTPHRITGMVEIGRRRGLKITTENQRAP